MYSVQQALFSIYFRVRELIKYSVGYRLLIVWVSMRQRDSSMFNLSYSYPMNSRGNAPLSVGKCFDLTTKHKPLLSAFPPVTQRKKEPVGQPRLI